MLELKRQIIFIYYFLTNVLIHQHLNENIKFNARIYFEIEGSGKFNFLKLKIRTKRLFKKLKIQTITEIKFSV